MDHAFAILKTIVMTYNEHNITTYKQFMYDGFNTFISTKNSYLLYFNVGSLDSLVTPYGTIKVSGFIESNELYQTIYDKILMRIKGTFIKPNIYVIQLIENINEVKIPYPLLKSTPYTDDEIKTLYILKPVICAFSKTNGNVYNAEIDRLVSLGIIQDELGILNKISDEQSYYDAIDTIFSMKMYTSEETNIYRRTPKLQHKYSHILGLLMLTDTPIKGLTY
jgi:hypothetical protein